MEPEFHNDKDKPVCWQKAKKNDPSHDPEEHLERHLAHCLREWKKQWKPKPEKDQGRKGGK